jgi:hypothetical protein
MNQGAFMFPTKAYDLKIQRNLIRDTDARDGGWCFGLPPGITPEQWPLDRCNGYPLMHGFTLLLPEEYRCHGPDMVAISFFGVAFDHNDGGPMVNGPVEAALMSSEAPVNPLLRRLWLSHQAPHPKLHRMKDRLGCEYAVILLTETEFKGAFCQPPHYGDLSSFGGVRAPQWLRVGAMQAYGNGNHDAASTDEVPGHMRAPDLACNRAIRRTPRTQDPNAGKFPMDNYGDRSTVTPAKSGYQRPFYWADDIIDREHYRKQDWAQGHAFDHIGGTMYPAQNIPANFSPYYVEFDEAWGGYNFGGGNAQLDFQRMRFDWACG